MKPEWHQPKTTRSEFELSDGGVFRLHAHVEVADASRELPELSLLLTLSWNLIVMQAREAAATAAIIG